MVKKNILDLTIIVFIPAIPVIIFYILFEQLNYFELNEEDRSYVAGGPIAAYVVLLGTVWMIYERMMKRAKFVDQRLKGLTGKWIVESTSSKNGICYKGEFDIFLNATSTSLIFTGNFSHEDKQVAIVRTVASQIVDGTIHLVYTMQDQRKDGGKMDGYSQLNIKSDEKLEGIWSVTGSEHYGSVTYVKIT